MIIGLIEFIFNMYLSRIFGAEGLGLLSLVSPINCLFLSFMTEGLVVTISKNIGETPAFPETMQRWMSASKSPRHSVFVVPVPGGRRFSDGKTHCDLVSGRFFTDLYNPGNLSADDSHVHI